MKRIGLKVPEQPENVDSSSISMYNLIHLPKGRCQVDWWTNDNLDVGYALMEARDTYLFDNEMKANSFIRGDSSRTQPLDHSWYGLYGNPVWIHIDGIVLPIK